MADPQDAFSTLDDFILSLAEGVSFAQAELARANATGPGQSAFTYHLPRVEFELKMNLQVVEDEGLSRRYSKLQTARSTNKHLLFRPLAAEESHSTLEIAAVVRGAFVSVPRNAGLPEVVLETSLDDANKRAPVLTVRARSAAGEPLAGLQVEVNLDREESATLSANSGAAFSLANGTGFRNSVLTTDATGRASVVLDIAANQTRAVLALQVDAAGQNETLVYEVAL
jgi:hypothetical protein